MAASHRDSVLTASCIRTPVHPNTRAPITLYERRHQETARTMRGAREDDYDSENSSDEERSCKDSTCKDWVLDISKSCNSDKEYYIQLERLKSAHLQSMEQLEKMYERKLYLKDVQDMDIEKRSAQKEFRSAWERPLHPVEFDENFLMQEFTSNVSSALAEASPDESSDEDSSDSDSLASAREKIIQMWKGFTVEDYIKNIDYTAHTKSKGKTNRGKSKEWSHKITIPEPFEMTVRESKKKEMCIKSKSEIEFENNLLKKKLEEEAECQKKFRANPVPASVYLPLYHEIMERNEERRRFVKERSKDILLASQEPFQFIEREEHKKKMRKMQFMNLPKSTKNKKHFKAKPVPKSIYGSTASERLKEEELYRGIRIHMRSQELLHSSTYPTNTLAPKTSPGNRKPKCYKPNEEKAHKPTINTYVPNFKTLHQKHHNQVSKNKNPKHVTICDPFNLCTVHIPSHKEKILRDIEADEQHLKETRWPYKSLRSPVQRKSPRGEEPTESPRSTESSKRREQAIRKQEMHRAREYLREIDAMKERVSRKPLLLERTMRKNAFQSAEKHYLNVLKDLGISENFVSKKGRTVDLHDHDREDSSTEEEQSLTEGTLKIADLRDDEEQYDEEYENSESEDDKHEESSTEEDCEDEA
ncbi:protein FAM161A [Discoglossus pictus]